MSVILNNRYRIIRTLGSGGFGDTFLSEDTHLPSARKCVVKQLKPAASDPEVWRIIQERFQREAVILELLGKGNDQIPELYAYFIENGQFYLVQQYIEGATLAQEIAGGGAMDEPRVRSVVLSLLRVLDYVHSQGVIHRDIKPDNIIIRKSDGNPVLIDFGAVKEVVSSNFDSQGYATSSIRIGSPGFMPLEQAAGKPVFSSDLYSLGLTAVYMLTGKPPQALSDQATGEIHWRGLVPRISSDFAGAIDRAIENHHRDRFKTAREMIDAIQGGGLHSSETDLDRPAAGTVEKAAVVEPVRASAAAPAASGSSSHFRSGILWGPIIMAIGISLAVKMGYVQQLAVYLFKKSEGAATPSVANPSPSPISVPALSIKPAAGAPLAAANSAQPLPVPSPAPESGASIAGQWTVTMSDESGVELWYLKLNQDGGKVMGTVSVFDHNKKKIFPISGELTDNRVKLTFTHVFTAQDVAESPSDGFQAGDIATVVLAGNVDGAKMSGSATGYLNKKVKAGRKFTAARMPLKKS